jgi:hypothetical protein
MMQGEFDYEATLVKIDKQSDWIVWSGQILIGLFGCIVTLILIDIFLGYTVTDIQVGKSNELC